MNGEAISKAGNGENPQYPLPRRGEQQVTPGLPGVLAATRQRCHAAGAATPLESMNSSPARSTMIRCSRAAIVPRAVARQ
jgi:hypothetical protein